MADKLTLPRNCGNCQHFDGDVWCALPNKQLVMQGPIQQPALLVCAKHEPKERES